MQKIIIKNFAGIESAEIEIKKVLVLIGEQASGKSTIAKLIYFFKSLRDDIFSQINGDTQFNSLNIPSDFIFPTRAKFYDFFGSTYHLPDFEIVFYYSVENTKYLQLRLNKDKKLFPTFSPDFFNNDFVVSIGKLKKLIQKKINSHNIYEQLAHEENKFRYVKQLSELISNLFAINQTDLLFIIAGRNATVSYSDLFDKYLFANLQNSLEENKKRKFEQKEYTIDETLMLNFMKRMSKIKEFFKKYRSLSELINAYESRNKKSNIKDILEKIEKKITKILKGQYIIDNYGEKIVINTQNQDYVYLHNASSGQQESIRILQDIFLSVLESYNQSSIFRIIEEPEAHLFPIAQKQLIELLALMVNHNQDNQLIITTHSPYILTVFNNLLFAKRVVEKNPSVESEVSQIIPQESWLDANQFSAYSLGNHYWEGEVPYCQSIFNPEQGTIEQNYLDSVSEILGRDFDQLYRIHARSFTRR